MNSIEAIMERPRSLVEIAGTILDAAGVLVVVGGAVVICQDRFRRRPSPLHPQNPERNEFI